ncbi:MAG: hypothetical protein IT527_08325, partial [Nitrosomonas sp.]|nr:hypothetical protein [Nitrosomonas sp.]
MNKSLFSLSVLAGWAFTLVSVIAVAAGPDTSGQVQQSAQQVASAPKHAKTALA